MLRLGGLAKGNMQQCIRELTESTLPEDFKLRQVRSLLRYLREVSSLVDHIRRDSGFEGDISSYLEILCAKEDADLIRRVSHTRVLRQVRVPCRTSQIPADFPPPLDTPARIIDPRAAGGRAYIHTWT